MSHCTSPAAEELLEQKIPVLDHGFVRLITYMGNDNLILDAARVSTGSSSKGPLQDRNLIFYLMEHRHTSPFEQVVLTFHCKMPIFVARQWVRHRTARLNEVSGRYSILPSKAYLPEFDRLGPQSKSNKQGTDESLLSISALCDIKDTMRENQEAAFSEYDKYINEHDLSREVARINLPLSTYTEWYWQIDLHNLFHFLKLRLDEHAQWEIRQYAQKLAKIARAVAPVAYEAFEEHVLHAVTLSAGEAGKLLGLLRSLPADGWQALGRDKAIYEHFCDKFTPKG